ncbi:hypothetical protein BZG36_01934 [Bifiguratus adelaidae]|uniref:Flavin-nucleotide-binding protein n=1 Tax=Bifiguratus adelaidae TaxID=1938954 RepID=A0A261Y3U0_9FUNG|nr:hypothetical protein BZG36_01934 [Bifiguratus adelaidae]
MDYTPKDKKAINRLERYPTRGRYDQETVFSILDKGLVCHVGFTLPYAVSQNGMPGQMEDWPMVIPMVYGRIEDTLYLHGHLSSRLLQHLSEDVFGDGQGPATTITVTETNGLVLALSTFNHSLNYRSACCFGYARLVEDADEKLVALKAIANHAYLQVDGDRWSDTRTIKESELASTRVVAVKIVQASAKVRQAPVGDDKSDVQDAEVTAKVWAGVVPLKTTYGEPQTMSYSTNVPIPEYVRKLRRL